MSRIDTFSVYVALDKLRIRPNTWLVCRYSPQLQLITWSWSVYCSVCIFVFYNFRVFFGLPFVRGQFTVPLIFFWQTRNCEDDPANTLSHANQTRATTRMPLTWICNWSCCSVQLLARFTSLANQFFQSEPDQVVWSISIRRLFPLRWMLKRNHTSISTFFKLHKMSLLIPPHGQLSGWSTEISNANRNQLSPISHCSHYL